MGGVKSPGSIEARVLLSLKEWSGRRNDLVAPYWVTQRGISEKSGVERANVSRALGALMSQDAVSERRAYVEGEGRAKKVYFLTDAGEGIAQKLAEAERAFIVHPPGLRANSPFLGRGGEMEEVAGWLRDPRGSALFIQGLPGIGKTTLLLNVIERSRSKSSVFYFRLREWTSIAHFLRELAEFLSRHKRGSLAALIDAAVSHGSTPDPGVALFEAERGLSGLRALVMLDDYHDASGSMQDYFASFAEMASRAEARLIVAGRRQARPFDPRAVAAGRARILKLDGLDLAAFGGLLARRASGNQLLQKQVADFHRLTKGNPLFGEIMADSSDLGRPSPIRDFLRDEVDLRLEGPERLLLRRVCVFRLQVPLAAFGGPGDLGVLGSLMARSLVETDSARSTYSLHDLIRDYFQSSLSSEESHAGHARAASFYARSQDPFEQLEHLWHLSRGGDDEEFAARVNERFESIIVRGLASPMLDVLRDSRNELQDPRIELAVAWCLISLGEFASATDRLRKALRSPVQGLPSARLHEALAHAFVMEGEFAKGEAACREGLVAASRLPSSREVDMAVLLLRKSLGTTMRHQLRLREAAAVYSECLAMAKRLGARREEGMFHNNLGVTHHRSGRDDRALEEYGRALKAYREAGEVRLAAQSTINASNIRKARGEYAKALEGYHEVLRTCDRFGDRATAIIAYHNLLVLHTGRGEFDLAAFYLARGLEFARLTRNEHQGAMVEFGAAEYHELRGDLPAARESLERVISRAKALDDRELFFRARVHQARLLALAGLDAEAGQALQESEAAIRGAESANLLADLGFSRATVLNARGERKRAAREIEKAIAQHAEVAGEVDTRARMLGLQAAILMEVGDIPGARKALRVAERIFERIGAKQFAAQTREALASVRRAGK